MRSACLVGHRVWRRSSITSGAFASWRASRPVSSPLAGVAGRHVGTQTPLSRARQQAFSKTSAALAAVAGRAGGAGTASAAEAEAEAWQLAGDAQAAALRGEAAECLRLVWALRELPREQSIYKAINAVRGEPPRTLLQALVLAGLQEPVRMLLELAPSAVRLKDEEGMTALHLAAEGNHAGVAQLLLARGRAHADARDARGRTPLQVAAELGHARTGRVLMRFGADPGAIDSTGRTPQALAVGGEAHLALGPWLEQFTAKRTRTNTNAGKVRYFKGLGAELPAHIAAPKLALTPVGYCPIADGEVDKVVQLPRGIRCKKSRPGPSSPKCHVNWYSPRG